jgi:ABC-type uncharacterized transport system ATPase subunit
MRVDQVIATLRQTDAPLAADLQKTAVAAESSAPLPSIRISMHFGGIVTLDDVSFDVRARKICGLIRPNGADKTTLFL